MTVAVVTQALVLVGATNITPFTGEITDTPSVVTVYDSTTLADGGYECSVTGIKSGSYGFSGFGDFASDGINAAFTSASLGSQYGVSVALPGSAAGDPASLGRGVLTRLPYTHAVSGGPTTLIMEVRSDNVFTAGYVAAPLASRTTSGLTGTAVAMTGPTAAQSIYANLHVTAASGTDLVVKVQSDDNGGFTSATDRITFSTVSATGWQVASLAGDLSTETHWRVVATIASGTFSFAAFFGVV